MAAGCAARAGPGGLGSARVREGARRGLRGAGVCPQAALCGGRRAPGHRRLQDERPGLGGAALAAALPLPGPAAGRPVLPERRQVGAGWGPGSQSRGRCTPGAVRGAEGRSHAPPQPPVPFNFFRLLGTQKFRRGWGQEEASSWEGVWRRARDARSCGVFQSPTWGAEAEGGLAFWCLLPAPSNPVLLFWGQARAGSAPVAEPAAWLKAGVLQAQAAVLD